MSKALVIYLRTLVVALVVSACAPHPAGVGDGTAISIVAAQVTIAPVIPQIRSADRSYVDALLPLVITNGSATAVLFSGCSITLERLTGGNWQSVFAPVCALNSSIPDIRIEAGAQRTVNFEVSTVASGAQWTAPIQGQYRVRFMLRTDRETVPPPAGLSSVFTLLP